MTVSNEIITVLNDLGSRFGIALDWSNQNVVPYIQDLITRIARIKILENSMFLGVGIIILILGIVLTIKHKNKYDDEFYNAIEYLLSVPFWLIIIGFIFATIGMTTLPKAIFLPELTAIEYVKNIVSTIQ